METFVMLTRLAPRSVNSPEAFEDIEGQTMGRVRAEVPDVEWLHNLAVLGPYDYLDIFRAPDVEAAMKVAALIRSSGHAHTEIWAAIEWSRFKELVGDLKH